MSKELDALELSIKNKLINFKSSAFDIIQGKMNLQLSLSDQDFRVLEKEAVKQNISKQELINLIEEVRSSINFEPRIESKRKINIEDVKKGQHIKLTTRDEKGEAIEELIYLGDNYLILIEHERGSLKPGDLLLSVTSPWNVGAYIEFHVYRNNERVIRDGKYSIYRTKNIQSLQFLYPQFDFEKFFSSQLTDPKTDN